MKKNLKTIILFLLCFLMTCLVEAKDTKSKKMWSILICTLDERKDSFDYIYNKLQKQINNHNLQEQIEILFFRDNRQHSIGYKRNFLLQQSSGEYVCFVDDDDDVHENYIAMLYEKLLEKPDYVTFVAIKTIKGKDPIKVIRSSLFPSHISPMKRSIACQFLFPEVNHQEDAIWASKIAKANVLKTEAIIDIPYYFYLFDGNIVKGIFPQPSLRLSIIALVDKNLENFLATLVNHPLFTQFELILINTHSTGNEEPVIKKYCEHYSNIIYEQLSSDVDAYKILNHAIKKTSADFITMINIDDQPNLNDLDEQTKTLKKSPSLDFIYSPDDNTSPFQSGVWRRSLHDRFGFFDESSPTASEEFLKKITKQGARIKQVKG